MTNFAWSRLFWPLILFAAIFIYFPGVNGIFLLDDAANLRALAEITPPLTWHKIYSFVVTAGEIASPTLRPVSMLSFALQYSAWPAHPGYFKLVNIAIHLVNGSLIYLVAVRLALMSGLSLREARLLACWSGAFWLLHPINVSTVLYIVQRMAMLSAMFSFAGVWLYLAGRERLRASEGMRGWILVSSSIVIAGGLAVLSKENGALLPLLLLVLECTVLGVHPIAGKAWFWWRIIFLWIPASIVISYVVFQGFVGNNVQRDFSVLERLLTQFRVLIDYLVKIFVPHPKAFGLYFDDYQKSTGLFHPLATIFSLVAILGIAFFAFFVRRRFPLFAFAVLWFLAGHAIESTTLQLELYFEHRNYVPLLGFAVAIPYLVYVSGSNSSAKKYIMLGGGAALATLIALTVLEVLLWSNPLRQAITWGAEKPDSLRARSVMAGVFAVVGDYDRAYKEYQLSSRHFRDTAGPLSDAIALRCMSQKVPLADLNEVQERLLKSKFSFAPINNLSIAVEALESGKCPGLQSGYLVVAINALLTNPRFNNSRVKGHLYFLLARLYAIDMKLAPAVGYAEMANEHWPSVNILIQEAEWLISAGLYVDALDKLSRAEQYASGSYLKNKVYADTLSRDKADLAKLIASRKVAK